MAATAGLLSEIVAAADAAQAAREIVVRYRKERRSIPGFGHPQHKPDDPRSLRLFQIAREAGIAGSHVTAIHALSHEVDVAFSAPSDNQHYWCDSRRARRPRRTSRPHARVRSRFALGRFGCPSQRRAGAAGCRLSH